MDFLEKEVLDLIGRMNNLGIGGGRGAGGFDGLGAILEESEEESNDEDDEIVDSEESASRGKYGVDLEDSHFSQAFSPFTCEKIRKIMIVVDLQGVFNKRDDISKCYELTDPGIHKHWKRRSR